MKNDSIFRKSAAALFLVSALAASAGCADRSQIGPAQADHGPMGATSTGSSADLPSRNSQSTPIDRPN